MIDEGKLYTSIHQVVRWTVGGVLGGVVVLLVNADSVTGPALAATAVLFVCGIAIEYRIRRNEEMMNSDAEDSRESS